MIDINIMVFSIYRLLHERLLNNNAIHDDGVPVRPKNDIPILGYHITLLLPPPPLWDYHLSPFLLIFCFMAWQD